MILFSFDHSSSLICIGALQALLLCENYNITNHFSMPYAQMSTGPNAEVILPELLNVCQGKGILNCSGAWQPPLTKLNIRSSEFAE